MYSSSLIDPRRTKKSRTHSKITPKIKFEITFLIEKCRKRRGKLLSFWNWKKLPNCTEK